MKFKKFICAILSFVCMLCLGLGISLQYTHIAKAEAPTVSLTSVDTEYNNTVWGGATMAVGLIFDKNFTAKAYNGNEGGYDAPIISSVKAYTKINGQSNAIQLSFLLEDNKNRIAFLYDNSLLTVPAGQEYTTFTIEAGAPFGGEYLPAITLYLVEGKWQATKPVPAPDPVTENVTVTNIHNRNGGGQRLLLFLSNSDYTTNNTTVDLSSVNVLDYVNVYTSKTEYKTLREIYQGNALAKIWGEANALGFAVDGNYHGTAVYAIEIKKGAQFPAATNDYTTYVVSETITYYNTDYQSSNAELNGWAIAWTTQKPVEPTLPQLGTPDVEFVDIHSDNNNSVWGGATRAVRLVFSDNFNAKAYDGNDGGFDAAIIAEIRNFVKINGKSLGNRTFLQIDNENSITFLYDESLLVVPEGQEYTTLTIEAGAPFGGHYLPAVTLYFNGKTWQATKPVPAPDPVTENVTVTNIHNRKGGDQRLLIFISNSDYTEGNTAVDLSSVNVLDYVNVYTSKTEYKTLREIYQGDALAKIWGEANALGFAVDGNYHGTAVYAIEIKAGAQFPATTNSYTTYVVSETITYYNKDYQSTNAELNGWAVVWTTEKPAEPETPVEPEVPEAGTPSVALTKVDSEYNNSVWGGATMAVGLIFDKNFTAKAYDANEGGFDAPLVATVKAYTKINGQGDVIQMSFLVEENANRIVFLYDSSLLTVPEGAEYTTFTIEEGAPFGGEYLPAITLYLANGKWQATEPVPDPDPVTESVTVTNIHNRFGGDQKLLLFISNSDYETANTAVDLSSVNVLDYVNVYTSETEYKTLREIYQGNPLTKVWGEANSFGVTVDANYHGTAVYAVEIKAGAQFPAATNGYTTYVVSEDVIYYNLHYKLTDTSFNDFSTAWTREKPEVPDVPVDPETPVEPEAPVDPGTPDVEFVGIHNDNNMVWGGTTRALRLVFSENFTAKAYDGNMGGFNATVISAIRNFVKINGQSLNDLTFLQIENENSITFLYDESLLSVASGTRQTIFTIEEGAPFGGRYLPAVTLYFNGETWQVEEIDLPEKLLGIVATQNNSAWDAEQNSVRLQFDYSFNNTENYNINDADGLNMLSKLTFNGVALTGDDILIFTEDIGGNTITMVYKKALFEREKEEGVKYHTLALTESVNYLGVDIPAFTLYLRNDAWITEMLPIVEMVDVETAVGYNTSSLIHIRDWNLDGDETTAVNNMILFFLPSGGFPEGHNLFLNLDKVAEYNVFDKIKLHMITPNADADENGFVTLRQVFNAGGWYPSSLSGGKDKIVAVNMWETVNCIAFSMGAEYTAESFDYVIIEEGCEFPNYYYTNKVNVDYVQNGESVDYENLEKVSFWQTETVKMFTNPADFQGPSHNTNWGIDTNMGEINVSGVDYADGYVIIQLENSNYPTEADGDNLNQNISAGNAPMALNMLADIYVNGISLYDRVVHFGANGITAYYNYNGYGNFAISVVLANENEVVTEIILGKDLRIPLYGMSDMAAAAYGIMYKETAATVSYSKGEQDFAQDEEIFWTVVFNDGENVKTVKVAHGEILAASDIPETPVKEGYEFVSWVYGIDGMYTFEATSNIATCYYLTANWKEASEETPSNSSSDNVKDSGCGGCGSVSSAIGTMTSLLVLAGIGLLKKKEN